jgi:hypothetical protein
MLLILWNYFNFGALVLSSTIFVMLLLLGHSYRLMFIFFSVAAPVTISLMIMASIFVIIITLSLSVSRKNHRTAIRSIVLWIFVFILSLFSFLGVVFTNFKVSASDSFENQKYYLIKFSRIDSYEYKLYTCDSTSLFCRSSSKYIGIPFQNQSIFLRYSLKTRKVYIQNADQTIQIPDQ